MEALVGIILSSLEAQHTPPPPDAAAALKSAAADEAANGPRSSPSSARCASLRAYCLFTTVSLLLSLYDCLFTTVSLRLPLYNCLFTTAS